MRKGLQLLFAICGLLIIVWLGYSGAVNLKPAFGILAQMDLFWFAASSLTSVVLGALLSAARFRMVLEPFCTGGVPGLLSLWRLQIESTAVTNVTLSPAGEAFRLYRLRRFVPIPACVMAQALEKLVEILGLGVVCAFLAMQSLPAILAMPARLFPLLLVLAALGHWIIRRSALSLTSLGRVGEMLDRVLSVSTSGLNRLSMRHSINAGAISVLADASNALCAFCAMQAVGVQAGLTMCLAVVLSVRASAVLPAPPAHLGVQDAAMAGCLLAFGVDEAHAIAAAAAYHVAGFLPPLLIGGPLAIASLFGGGRATASTDGSE